MRSILGWIATLILCSPVLVTAAHAKPAPPRSGPCVPIYGHPAASEWCSYRYGTRRTGAQPLASALSNPAKVAALSVKWSFPASPAGGFKASPIAVNDTVFIGSQNGYFYALDAATGALKWQFPKASDPGLLGSCGSFGRYGIQSSATFANIGGKEAVIFGAPDPDPSAEGGLGSARLFAFTLSGALIWKSDIVAHLNGCTPGSLSELHERIAYSSPLVLGDKVYMGVHDAGDSPIQNGKVVAVDLNSGKIDSKFNFISTGTRGGGVWNTPATDGEGVYFTTGNTRCWNGGCQSEPNPNHGLSMIRVDEENGNIVWAFQPVPYNLDDDPDWAAGATVMSTSCGELIASVQKDGWSYAVNAGNGTPGAPNVRWQFPPTGYPFDPNGTHNHGDTHYKRLGAAWNNVLIITTGGESLVHDGVTAGYGKLHALNACATTEKTRVRWIADIPNSSRGGYSLGAPTVTGGIVFIGTDQGHLVVLGDPSVVPAVGSRCSNIDYTTPSTCNAAGYALVPIPKVLANVAMPDGGNIAGLRNEPALARGRVFVGTLNGHVYMLEP
jgi:outer membrane protein assembly factor BamB